MDPTGRYPDILGRFKIVVSDTSPLTALLTMGGKNLLPRHFTEVVILEAVQKELAAAPGVICEGFKILVPVGQALSTHPCHALGMKIKKSIRAGGNRAWHYPAHGTRGCSFSLYGLVCGRKCLSIKPPQHSW
jgi:hypothetical protein